MGDTLAGAQAHGVIDAAFVLDEREVERLDRLVAVRRSPKVVLDLSAVRVATGLGVWALARLQERWNGRGTVVRVQALSPAMYAVLEQTGVDAVLLVEDFGTPVPVAGRARAGVQLPVVRGDGGGDVPYLVLEDDPAARHYGQAGLARLVPGLSTLPPVTSARLTIGHAVRLRVGEHDAACIPATEVALCWIEAAVDVGACRVLVTDVIDAAEAHPYRMIRSSLHAGRCVGGIVLVEIELP